MGFPSKQVSRGELRIHESLDDLSADLVEYISELSEASVNEHGAFAIAISGGSLIGFLGKLSEAPYIKTIDWPRWHIYWTDERVVAKTHVDSNYRLAKEGLLSKVPIIPSHVHSINDSLSAEDAASDYEFSVRQLVRTRVINVSDISDCPKFDLIILGVGADCHVASLFPNHPALTLKDDWVTYITDSPEPPPEQITLTLPVINSASNVAIIGTGGSRAEAVRLAVSDVATNSQLSCLPARMVEPANGKLVWFLDKEAASGIEDEISNACLSEISSAVVLMGTSVQLHRHPFLLHAPLPTSSCAVLQLQAMRLGAQPEGVASLPPDVLENVNQA
ncbi:hypothetical protein V2J09_003606 [Rumex salicifolius]